MRKTAAHLSCGLIAICCASLAQATPVQVQQSGDPRPNANDVIILDSRDALQRASTLAGLWTALTGRPHDDPLTPGLETDAWSLAQDIDGQGTKAARRTWKAFCCGDRDGRGYIATLLRQPDGRFPREIYIQWKQRLGRTPTGGGIGDAGVFQLANPRDPGRNDGRRNMVVFRETPDLGSANRFEYTWYGDGNVSLGMGNNVPRSAFSPLRYIGQVMVQTLYLKADSSVVVRNGLQRLWVNGRRVADYQRTIGAEPFHRINFPTTFRSPPFDMTEYFWDLLIWSPR